MIIPIQIDNAEFTNGVFGSLAIYNIFPTLKSDINDSSK